ncbi:MAG: zf-HC2 domain-containing protein [Acidobacteria bacterium]|nr:zf-HC2 domain-containing protein [Acidobacteriota bacterium]
MKGAPNQSTQPEMDGLKKLVSGRLRVEGEEPHPDPELLGALAEGSLSARDRSNLLGHLAACVECRDVLYLAQPDLVDHTQLVFLPRKQSRFPVRWATLAASVTIAAGIIVTNRGIFRPHTREGAPAVYSADRTVQQGSLAHDGQDTSVTDADTRARTRPQEKHMTARPQANLQFDESGEVHVAPPSARAGAAVEVKPAVWRLSPDGGVEGSVDSGNHWQAVPVGDSVHFRAITSLGNEVWVGGDQGALYHSPDSGRSWARVTPAASGKKLASEITGIKFSDPENGIVTTANGQVWSTSDDGRDWQLK